MELDIVRAGALTSYRRIVRELGGDPSAMLAQHGLSDAMLDDPDYYIPYSALIRLLEASALRFDCPDLGLRLSARQSLSALGMMSISMRNAPTIRAAIEAASRSIYLHAPGLSITMAAAPETGREMVLYELLLESCPSAAQTMEMTLALAVRITRMLAGRNDIVAGVHFMHAQSGPMERYHQYLGLTPVFEANENALIMPRAGLDHPIAGANSELMTMFDSLLGLHAPNPAQQFEEQLGAVITRLIRSGMAGLDDAADATGLHRRTLQRRLAERGTSFEAVRDTVRRRLAGTYLAQGSIPLAHVAQLLSCADQSVLTRHCRRWFNMTPGRYRREISQNRK